MKPAAWWWCCCCCWWHLVRLIVAALCLLCSGRRQPGPVQHNGTTHNNVSFTSPSSPRPPHEREHAHTHSHTHAHTLSLSGDRFDGSTTTGTLDTTTSESPTTTAFVPGISGSTNEVCACHVFPTLFARAPLDRFIAPSSLSSAATCHSMARPKGSECAHHLTRAAVLCYPCWLVVIACIGL